MNKLPTVSVWIAGVWLLLLATAAAATVILPMRSPTDIDLRNSQQGPTVAHIAGTDELGRDVLSRVLNAARSTLNITAGATLLSMLLGTVLGGAAGYLGGWADRAILFVTDLFWSIPFAIFVVLIMSIIGVSMTSLIFSIGLINWVSPARVVRAETARLAHADFILAARTRGYSEPRIFTREILPNLKKTILTLCVYCLIEVMTLETGLAFLGLSMPAPRPTWGGMLAEGMSYFSSAWWIVVSAAVSITMTLGSLQILARGIEKSR